jgi:multicomponent Na+:H+ antiporter subunit B
METMLILLLIIMICTSLFALYAKDLLSAIVSFGIVGFGLVIAFLLLQAPDLAIVQIVVETISLIIMISVLIICTREDVNAQSSLSHKGIPYLNAHTVMYYASAIILVSFLAFYFVHAISSLDVFGVHTTRMAREYVDAGVEHTGSANLVTGIVFDFRGYDTLGEATILFTAVIGVLTLLRISGKKSNL